MSPAGAWDARHARICADLDDRAVARIVAEHSAHAARECATARLLRRHLAPGGPARTRGAQIDSALAVWWAAQRAGAPPTGAGTGALPALRALAHDALSERDFGALTTLQRGATGAVEVVRCRFDRRLYVLKSVLKGAARREPFRLSPMLESAVLAADAEPAHTPQLLAAFQSPGSVHLVLEYFPAGDLDGLLQSAAQASREHEGKSDGGGLLAEAWVVRYAADMVAAVAWVHELGFAHRDIKPSNFLLHRTGRLKLCDFATCAPYAAFPPAGGGSEPQRCVLAYYTRLPAGTCDYIAPEILRCEERRIASECPSPGALRIEPDTLAPGGYGPAVDWWSVGVVLYEMVFGQLPFWAPRPAAVYTRIAHHERYFAMDPAVHCSAALRSLIAALVCADHVRLGARCSAQVQQHPVFAHVDWSALHALPVPFVPSLDTSDAAHDSLSVLHSPMPGTDSPTCTPPSFSTFGPLAAFPGYADSLDDLLATPPTPGSWPSSPMRTHDARAAPSPEGPAPTDADVAFFGFSELPPSTAFARDVAHLPRPLASTPLAKPARAVPLAALLTTPEPSRLVPHRTRPAHATPASPYPFPIAQRSHLRTPLPPSQPRLSSVVGSDTRHSGGSTRKRDLSERAAWAEMMDAVQRSARNLDAPDSPPAPPERTRSPDTLSFSSSSSASDGSPENMHTDDRPALRPRRSTRQLLIDAQVTSTPTRSMSAHFHTSPGSPGHAPRLRRTRRTGLRGSASVRDLREMRAADARSFGLPTLVDTSPRAPDSIEPTAASPSPTPLMDSRRMLSEYRRGNSHLPRTVGDAEDAFGRRTTLASRGAGDRTARRMQSSLGLSGSYRYGGARAEAEPDDGLARLTREHDGLRTNVSSLEEELRALRLRVAGGGH